MANYDSIDLDYTWDGDFDIDSSGDIKDTSDDLIRAMENEIRTIVKSEIGDWKNNVNLGANLYEFIGEANTRKLGQSIERRVQSSLTRFNTVFPQDLTVRAVPVHRHVIMLVLSVEALPTRYNRLQTGEKVVVTLTYDTQEDGIFFLPQNEVARAGR